MVGPAQYSLAIAAAVAGCAAAVAEAVVAAAVVELTDVAVDSIEAVAVVAASV